MILVPRQLQRVGMTGDVPYYGGRLRPAQAYAASHSAARPAPPAATPAPAVRAATSSAADPQASLQHLLDTGVITPEEYQQLAARVTSS